jgi:adenylate cyclase
MVDRYVQATSSAILTNGGHIISVAGDGIMSVFGAHTNATAAAQQALVAAADIWRNIDRISTELAGDIKSPLRFGIGVHSGPAVLGALGPRDRPSLQFLGETGNIAARLQALTKEMNCAMIVSAVTVASAGLSHPPWRGAEVDIRGGDIRMSVFLIDRCDDLRRQAE